MKTFSSLGCQRISSSSNSERLKSESFVLMSKPSLFPFCQNCPIHGCWPEITLLVSSLKLCEKVNTKAVTSVWLACWKPCGYKLQHGCNQESPTNRCWSEKSNAFSKVFTMWKHSLVLDEQSPKTMAADGKYRSSWDAPACLSRLCDGPAAFYHARHPSRSKTSLLVCAAEDSWTSSFLYKSPSAADSGDSDLITAGNKPYQRHLVSGFILWLPPLLRRGSRSADAGGLRSSKVFTVEFREDWRGLTKKTEIYTRIIFSHASSQWWVLLK